MSAELIGILAMGATLLVGLGGLLLVLFGWLRADIKDLSAKQDAATQALTAKDDALAQHIRVLTAQTATMKTVLDLLARRTGLADPVRDDAPAAKAGASSVRDQPAAGD